MRTMYVHDRLRESGGITLAGAPLDLGRVDTPAYVVGTREDHIAPWRGVWRSARLLSGRVRFVLGESGHIAGIVNPPSRSKYGFRVAPADAAHPDAWHDAAYAHAGSWWPDWQRWLARRSGGQVPARAAGTRRLQAIEDAPGSYVRRRLAGTR
jgi:polyhydroxyalkanoate synthase